MYILWNIILQSKRIRLLYVYIDRGTHTKLKSRYTTMYVFFLFKKIKVTILFFNYIGTYQLYKIELNYV